MHVFNQEEFPDLYGKKVSGTRKVPDKDSQEQL